MKKIILATALAVCSSFQESRATALESLIVQSSEQETIKKLTGMTYCVINKEVVHTILEEYSEEEKIWKELARLSEENLYQGSAVGLAYKDGELYLLSAAHIFFGTREEVIAESGKKRYRKEVEIYPQLLDKAGYYSDELVGVKGKPLEVLAHDDKDHALFKLAVAESEQHNILEFFANKDEIYTGQPIIGAGYRVMPDFDKLKRRLLLDVTRGYVRSLGDPNISSDDNYLDVDLTEVQGMSGGPVITADGKLVGLISVAVMTLPTKTSLLLHIEGIKKFLDENDYSWIINNEKTTKSHNSY